MNGYSSKDFCLAFKGALSKKSLNDLIENIKGLALFRWYDVVPYPRLLGDNRQVIQICLLSGSGSSEEEKKSEAEMAGDLLSIETIESEVRTYLNGRGISEMTPAAFKQLEELERKAGYWEFLAGRGAAGRGNPYRRLQ